MKDRSHVSRSYRPQVKDPFKCSWADAGRKNSVAPVKRFHSLISYHLKNGALNCFSNTTRLASPDVIVCRRLPPVKEAVRLGHHSGDCEGHPVSDR